MTKYCKDMCIVCFAPKRYDSQWLYAPVNENSHETCVSEIGLVYQDLIQVSLTCKETGPQYVCNYCKTQLSLFHKFKLKALDAYKKVSEEAEENENSAENLFKVEEITVFDVSTKQTEKFEIQYLDDQEEQAADIIEIEDSKTFVDGVPSASANGLNTHQSSISVNSSNSNSTSSSSHIKCQLCSKLFESNEAFNIHWKEHEELPQYSFGTISQYSSEDSDLEIIDFDGRIDDLSRHPFRNGLQSSGCTQRNLVNRTGPGELSYSSNVMTWKQSGKRYMTENCSKCPQKFHSQENYLRHTNIHKGQKLLSCGVCGKSFHRLCHLQFHMRTHTDERPFECEICHKRFRSNSHLKYHHYSHGEKQFQCEICLQMYSTPRTLSEHLKFVHKRELPYSCDICNKQFMRRHKLERHRMLHYRSNSRLMNVPVAADQSIGN